eukprot:scaffold149278_cov21-Tisochrysis_lutea.AAC.2
MQMKIPVYKRAARWPGSQYRPRQWHPGLPNTLPIGSAASWNDLQVDCKVPSLDHPQALRLQGYMGLDLQP